MLAPRAFKSAFIVTWLIGLNASKPHQGVTQFTTGMIYHPQLRRYLVRSHVTHPSLFFAFSKSFVNDQHLKKTSARRKKCDFGAYRNCGYEDVCRAAGLRYYCLELGASNREFPQCVTTAFKTSGRGLQGLATNSPHVTLVLAHADSPLRKMLEWRCAFFREPSLRFPVR
jgi:hypothetical protein